MSASDRNISNIPTCCPSTALPEASFAPARTTALPLPGPVPWEDVSLVLDDVATPWCAVGIATGIGAGAGTQRRLLPATW